MKIATPTSRLWHVADSDEKPSLGYVYDRMIKIHKAVITIFMNKFIKYGSYIKTTDDRWDRHLLWHLYVIACFFNLGFFFMIKKNLMWVQMWCKAWKICLTREAYAVIVKRQWGQIALELIRKF